MRTVKRKSTVLCKKRIVTCFRIVGDAIKNGVYLVRLEHARPLFVHKADKHQFGDWVRLVEAFLLEFGLGAP